MQETTTIGEALRTLREERDRLDAAINALEALLGTSGNRPNPSERAAAPIERHETLADSANRTAAVEQLFVTQPNRVWTAPDLAFAFGEDGNDREILKAYYNIVRRLSERGGITKLARGRYQLTDASTPAATGVEVGEESDSADPSWEIGGNRDEASVPFHDRGGDALV